MSIVKDIYRRWREAEIQTMSAVLAYHTLLAIIPTIGLAFLYLKKIGISRNWYELTRTFLLSQLDVSSDSTLIHYFDNITSTTHRASWSWLGLLILFYTSWNLINKFGQSLDKILHTAPDQSHIITVGLIKLNAKRLLVMVLLPLALMLSLVVTQWIRKDSWMHFLIAIETVGPFVALPIAWGVDIVAFFLVYHFIPRSHIPYRQAFKAALIAGPLSEITKLIFGAYSKHMVVIHKIYGIFAAIPLFILWVQIAWMIILGSALFVRFSPKNGFKNGR
jgi:membrane protein